MIIVNRIGYSSSDTNQIDDNYESGSWYEQSSPFEHIGLHKVSIFIRCFGSEEEIGTNASKDF